MEKKIAVVIPFDWCMQYMQCVQNKHYPLDLLDKRGWSIGNEHFVFIASQRPANLRQMRIEEEEKKTHTEKYSLNH